MMPCSNTAALALHEHENDMREQEPTEDVKPHDHVVADLIASERNVDQTDALVDNDQLFDAFRATVIYALRHDETDANLAKIGRAVLTAYRRFYRCE
jgi:hypothetical protein